jgi:hypothetical protein
VNFDANSDADIKMKLDKKYGNSESMSFQCGAIK